MNDAMQKLIDAVQKASKEAMTRLMELPGKAHAWVREQADLFLEKLNKLELIAKSLKGLSK